MVRKPTILTVTVLTLILICGSFMNVWAADPSLDNFQTVNQYTQGKFSDIEGRWFYDSVKAAYEKGIISGTTESTFLPDGKLRISEAITIAAKIHDIYTNGENTIKDDGDTWYEPYVEYAAANGIIADKEFDSSINRYASRSEMAHILFNSLPAEEFPTKEGNVVEIIPDVSKNHKYADDIYGFYLSGILAGTGADGKFTPESDITRGETAAIVSRIVNVDERIAVNITEAQSGSVGKDYVISWTDDVIEQAVRSILGKSTGDISRSELDYITKLEFSYGTTVYCNDKSVTILGVRYDDFVKDAADFTHFVNLEELCLYYTNGTDFSNMPALEKLTSLQVYISDNVKGLSGLTRLSNLESLNLYSTSSGDYTFLSSMTKLKELDIARTGITDLTPIAGLTNLKVLKIYGNECDAAAIAHLTGLEQVTVSNQVKNKEMLEFVPGYSNFNVSVNMGGQ